MSNLGTLNLVRRHSKYLQYKYLWEIKIFWGYKPISNNAVFIRIEKNPEKKSDFTFFEKNPLIREMILVVS